MIAVIYALGRLKDADISPLFSRVLQHISLLDHSLDFSKGIIDTSYIAYYISVIVLSLYFTVRVLESRRWT